MKKDPSTETNPIGKVIGRENEKEILKEIIASNRAEFVAVYGRRRVGKTYLIRNFITATPCAFFHVTGIQKAALEEQLEEFAKQIGATFYQDASISPGNAGGMLSKISLKQFPKFHGIKKLCSFLTSCPGWQLPVQNCLQP